MGHIRKQGSQTSDSFVDENRSRNGETKGNAPELSCSRRSYGLALFRHTYFVTGARSVPNIM